MSDTDETLVRSRGAAGVSFFGGIVMVVAGLLQLLEGLSAIRNDAFYRSPPQYLFSFNVTLWGWIHLSLGVVAIAVGVGILRSQPWGFFAGMFILVLSILTQFVFVPYYPVWALTVIAADVAVMWALCTRLREDWTIP
jgi:hypothetical protein